MEETTLDGIGTDVSRRKLLANSLLLLSKAQEELSDALANFDVGAAGASKRMGTAYKDLNAAVRLAVEMESKLNDWIAKNEPDAEGDDDRIDLDAARHQIGCRLARLRTCCGTG